MPTLVVIHSSQAYRDALRGAFSRAWPSLATKAGAALGDVCALLDDVAEDVLVLVEIQGTVRNTVTALLPLRRARPRARFGIVGESGTRRDMQDCVAAGIAGFLLKDLPEDRLIAAVGMMLDRHEFIPPSVAGVPVTHPGQTGRNGSGHQPRRPDLARLTGRQRDVLKLMVVGMSNRDIGIALGIAEATVKVHVAGVMRILGIKTRNSAPEVVMSLSADPEWASALGIETVVRSGVTA